TGQKLIHFEQRQGKQINCQPSRQNKLSRPRTLASFVDDCKRDANRPAGNRPDTRTSPVGQ
ncbi:MAG: hypothetical protein P8K79_02370, partial [Mariniblastus sp.]|nr:hypothetical protein [Mariniblastus sp.]